MINIHYRTLLIWPRASADVIECKKGELTVLYLIRDLFIEKTTGLALRLHQCSPVNLLIVWNLYLFLKPN